MVRKWIFGLICGIFLLNSAAFAQEPVQLRLNGPGEVEPGEEFTVAVELTGNPGFQAAQISLDHYGFTCLEAKTGDLLAKTFSAANPDNDGEVTLAAAATGTVTGDGTLLTLKLRSNGTKRAVNLRITQCLLTDPSGNEVVCALGNGLSPKVPALPEWGSEGVTRGRLTAALWALHGNPEPTGRPPFTDLTGAEEATQTAIAWAVEAGVTQGTGDGQFSPDGAVTRQELFTLLHRLSGGETGMEGLFYSIYDANFPDSEEAAPWAKPALYWGVYKGLLTGETLEPNREVTGPELNDVLTQYLEKYPIRGG